MVTRRLKYIIKKGYDVQVKILKLFTLKQEKIKIATTIKNRETSV